MPRAPFTDEERAARFWVRVDKFGPVCGRLGRCWLWTGPVMNKGYGKFRPLAHRFAYEHEHGTIPVGLSVLHKCDNPRCVRPSHLFLGTQQDNLADMRAKGRQVRGERQGQAKLTAAAVREIRSRYRRYSYKDGAGVLARQYGVGLVQIHRVVKLKAWRHVR